jgi:hypothetical protein
MSEEPEVDGGEVALLELRERVAGAQKTLLDRIGKLPGRDWTYRELVDGLWEDHRCRPPVAGIAIHTLIRDGSLIMTNKLLLKAVQKAPVALAL